MLMFEVSKNRDDGGVFPDFAGIRFQRLLRTEDEDTVRYLITY
jgi:hypothetical protein